MKTNWLGLAVSTGVMVAASSLIVYLWQGQLFLRELAAGWAVCLANGIAAGIINRRAATATASPRFLVWGILGNGLRFLAVLGIVLAVVLLGWGRVPAFAAAVVTGYLAFMVNEVAHLCRLMAPPDGSLP
jgi:hypothetical protein